MQKFNVFLVVLGIIILSFTFSKNTATAAEVTRINQKRGHVYINGRKDEGFVMGATVCFYSSSGEEITCGRVRKTSESRVMVKVNNRKAKRIKYGMEAKLVVKEKTIPDKGNKKESY